MGQPDGGWYDDDPPRILGSTPADGATGVTTKKVTIQFDEYIKLTDATQKVIVSPPQLEMPEIKEAGKKIVVELKDSLKPNMTYTIDFSDAISDNNEGNPLGNYTFTFSTGEQIDTFEVAGNVLDASNLEPVKGILVGLYDDLSDSAFRKKPLLRVSRTDGRGRFVIKGVAPGEYRVYALQDVDGNYLFNQKSEMIAFSHQTYQPSSKPDIRQDTIWKDTLHIDNIIQVPYTHFYPDDIVLLAFQEIQTERYLLKQPERSEPNRFTLYFSYGHPQLPQIRGLNFNEEEAFILEASAKKDTLTYWLRDTTLINQDTLRMELSYLMTDTAGILYTQVDTVDVLAKRSYEKRQKDLKKEMEEWEKKQEKLKKQGEEYDSIMPPKPLQVNYNVKQQMDPDYLTTFVMPSPLTHCDTTAIHLYTKIDSLWYNTPFDFHQKDSMLRTYEFIAEWQPDTEYSLEIDSAAFVDIYGLASKSYKQGIKVRSMDEYATLLLQLSGINDTTVVVELLDRSDLPIKQVRVENGNAEFFYLSPGTYYVRAFVDRNGNGKWDTGSYDDDLQAEEVYYYPRSIECKAKFDITLPWSLTGMPRTQQKPDAITKQKPDKEQQKLRNRNAERARQLGIEYIKKESVIK
ncbi:MAG: Ig-like domain-containing protein [Prevotella sp.]|nr:Ig-like domain-containing protein [Prevotella sp.]